MAQQRWELEQLSQKLGASRSPATTVSYVEPAAPATPTSEAVAPTPALPAWMTQRVSFLSAHLNQQQSDFQAAQQQTRQVFNDLLNALEPMAESFRAELSQLSQTRPNVHATIDPDRSVGVLTLLWHSVSFTVCDQYQPLAIERVGKSPLLACRIMATLGDYRNQHSLWETPETMSAPQEFASLFVPSPKTPPSQASLAPPVAEQCLLRFTHTPGDRVIAWDQVVPVFLSSILDALCGGGMLHAP